MDFFAVSFMPTFKLLAYEKTLYHLYLLVDGHNFRL